MIRHASWLPLFFFVSFRVAVPAGEQPGLEVFDSGLGEIFPVPPASRPDSGAVSPAQSPAYVPPPPVPDAVPYQRLEYEAPFPAESADAAAPFPLAQPPDPEAGIAPVPTGEFRTAVLTGFDVDNPAYPGLREAVAANDLRGAAGIVRQVLRERRVLAAALAGGVGASAETAPGYAYRRVFAAIGHVPAPGVPDIPAAAAKRIDAIVSAFAEPVVDSPEFGVRMEQALIRLHADIGVIRNALAVTAGDDGWLEAAAAYARAAAACDFFVFPLREVAGRMNTVFEQAAAAFYPDGASVAGDVAGVTGNLFQAVLALDAHLRDSQRLRRDFPSAWRTLARPVRHVLDIAAPNGILPAFGPRARRELTRSELSRLGDLFPPIRRRNAVRAGLAGSRSFPNRSGSESYGGIFVSRNDEGNSARWLAARFGPAGNIAGTPAHNDFGTIALSVGNTDFIVDAGGYGGEAASGGAHNVLSLDGEYTLPSTWNDPGRPVETVWRTNAALDYVSDRALFPDGRSWQRTLIYVKNLPGENRADYWLVLDHVENAGQQQPVRARIRFQLGAAVQAYNDGNTIVAAPGFGNGPILRFFSLDSDSILSIMSGTSFQTAPDGESEVFPASSAVDIERSLSGEGQMATLLYPGDSLEQRPLRIERDSDIVSGRANVVIVDHGLGRLDVVAWARPGNELVTPTLNLQMSADLAVFRLRSGKFVRINFVNLEYFQAKEPEGGLWSIRVSGPAQTLTLEPERSGGWQAFSDPANAGAATLHNINLGPAISGRRLTISPGEFRPIYR
ncbi:MAG: heparinase II/III-family protein [Planctomycetota bacterium]|nr:heparinase II/III-family protein [Planctomycetota bacterium]